MLNTNYVYIMCHKYSHDMCFEPPVVSSGMSSSQT